MKIPNIDYFKLEELVHPWFMDNFGIHAKQFLNPKAVQTLVALREQFGVITVNDWHLGGGFTLSGLRPLDDRVGAANSLHKYGGAFDCKFRDVTVEEAHGYILANPEQFPHLSRLEAKEATPTWLHFDTAWTGCDHIVVFNP